MIIISRQLHSESTDTFPSPCSYFWHLSVVPDLSPTEGRLERTPASGSLQTLYQLVPPTAMNARLTPTPPRLALSPGPPMLCPAAPRGAGASIPMLCLVMRCPQATKWPLLLTARTPCSLIHPPSGLPVPASYVPSLRHHLPGLWEASGPPALALPDFGVPSSSDTLSPALVAGTWERGVRMQLQSRPPRSALPDDLLLTSAHCIYKILFFFFF